MDPRIHRCQNCGKLFVLPASCHAGIGKCDECFERQVEYERAALGIECETQEATK